MRTIKFRGKRVDNGEWVYGFYWDKPLAYGHQSMIYVEDAIDEEHEDAGWIEVDRRTVGQFTGLHDKDGHEIYEGDVLFNSNKSLITSKDDPRTYLVKWVEGKYGETGDTTWLKQKPCFEIVKINPKDKRYMSLVFTSKQIKIIGNIHDNPELLK